MPGDPTVVGLADDMRAWVLGALPDLGADHVLAQNGFPDRLAAEPQAAVVLIGPVGGFPEEADLAKRRLQIRVVAETFEAARRQFERVRLTVLRYPYLVQQSVPSFDMAFDLPNGVSKPTHGTDFYVTVPYLVPA